VLLHIAQEFPARGAVVALANGAAVDGDRGGAGSIGAVEDLEKIVAAFIGVVDTAAHLERDRHVGRHGVANAVDDLERHRGLAEMVATAATTEDFFHRAAEVDVDHVEAVFDKF
jgi:hypothetical protein